MFDITPCKLDLDCASGCCNEYYQCSPLAIDCTSAEHNCRPEMCSSSCCIGDRCGEIWECSSFSAFSFLMSLAIAIFVFSILFFIVKGWYRKSGLIRALALRKGSARRSIGRVKPKVVFDNPRPMAGLSLVTRHTMGWTERKWLLFLPISHHQITLTWVTEPGIITGNRPFL